MFKALIGDIFADRAQTFVNAVNCASVMGKGVALEFKKRYPAMFEDYVERCACGEVKLRRPYLYQDLSGTRIVNFPTKDHWRSPSRLSDIEDGLDHFAPHGQDWGMTSVAFPALGCGNGGLEWAKVGPLLYAMLHNLDLDVEVYAPHGTSKTELTEESLSVPSK